MHGVDDALPSGESRLAVQNGHVLLIHAAGAECRRVIDARAFRYDQAHVAFGSTRIVVGDVLPGDAAG